jgi:hypothetical protein
MADRVITLRDGKIAEIQEHAEKRPATEIRW